MSEEEKIFPQRHLIDEAIKVKQEFIDSKSFYNKDPESLPGDSEKNATITSQQQTILINNLNNHQNSSSITIVTSNNNEKEDVDSSTSTINICINNHFNNNNVINKMQYSSSTNSNTSTPPPLSSSASTEDDEMDGLLMNSGFSTGQDVLVQRKDAKFYLGTITAMSATQCLVKFDDLSLYWANYDEVSRLNASFTEESIAMCVVCKKSEGIVEECSKCGRGYHNKCSQNGSSDCPRCSSISDRRSLTPFQSLPPLTDKSQLPYNIDILTWDAKHRVNDEQIYCYCGRNGQWDEKMLQCCKCLQWFHDQCVKQTVYPLYRGDRFYVFSCSICNDGVEFLRRMKMDWVDIVHLLLFNLYKVHKKKYLDLKNDIFPYAISNWSSLNLEKSIQNLSNEDIKTNIFETLRTSDRFQSGKEIKKNISNWGLRKYLPPPIQLVIFDSSVKITTQYLKDNTLVNLIDEEFECDKAVLRKNAENVMFVTETKEQEPNSTVTASTSSITKQKSTKIIPRSRTLRKRKMIYSGISRSSNDSCHSTSTRSLNDDKEYVHNDGSFVLHKKVGPLKLLEELIPRTPSFNGIHNPFRIPSPKKMYPKSKEVKTKFNRFDLNSKLAALKKSGVIIKNRQKLTAGQLKGEILIKKRKLGEKDILAENKIKRKRGRKPKTETEVGGTVLNPSKKRKFNSSDSSAEKVEKSEVSSIKEHFSNNSGKSKST
ncbi:PHF19 family protein [Megaselia abdita]